MPALTWMAVPPAKSRAPRSPIQPPYTHLKTGTNTRSNQAGANIAQAENFIRSATAPEIRAGVITANMPRKATVNRAEPPSSPVTPRPRRNAMSRLPRSAPSPDCARENPTIAHRMGITSRHQKFIISMFRTFLVRSMPP